MSAIGNGLRYVTPQPRRIHARARQCARGVRGGGHPEEYVIESEALPFAWIRRLAFKEPVLAGFVRRRPRPRRTADAGETAANAGLTGKNWRLGRYRRTTGRTGYKEKWGEDGGLLRQNQGGAQKPSGRSFSLARPVARHFVCFCSKASPVATLSRENIRGETQMGRNCPLGGKFTGARLLAKSLADRL